MLSIRYLRVWRWVWVDRSDQHSIWPHLFRCEVLIISDFIWQEECRVRFARYLPIAITQLWTLKFLCHILQYVIYPLISTVIDPPVSIRRLHIDVGALLVSKANSAPRTNLISANRQRTAVNGRLLSWLQKCVLIPPPESPSLSDILTVA